jgi:hypothetical protein
MARAVAVLTLLFAPAAAFAVETMRIHMGDTSGEVLLSGVGLGFSADVEDAALSPSPGGRSLVRVAGPNRSTPVASRSEARWWFVSPHGGCS